MQFRDFFARLEAARPTVRVEFETLRDIVNNCHHGVGKVTVKYFPDFPGAQFGNFIWLEDERTSPHEEPFNDAMVFINDRYREDRAMLRLIATKELMHVFDAPGQQAGNEMLVRKLIAEINSKPIADDASDAYQADRTALWKAIVTLVPPWIRDEFLTDWKAGTIKVHELVTRLWLPDTVVSTAMGDYYPVALKRVLTPNRKNPPIEGPEEDPNMPI